MKRFFIFLVAFVGPFASGCDPYVVHYSQDKTQYIYKSIKIDSLSVIAPITRCQWISNKEMQKKEDSLFDTYICIDSENIYYKKVLSINCCRNFKKIFKNNLNYHIQYLSNEDSITVADELLTMEKILKYKAVNTLTISQTLLNVLSKYPGNEYLLTSTIDYYSTYYKQQHSFMRMQCFLVNVTNEQVDFYNYRIWTPSIKQLPLNLFKNVLERVTDSFVKTETQNKNEK